MTVQQRSGRRSGTAVRRTGGHRRPERSRTQEALRPAERRRLIQLVVCGTLFTLLVAVKLLLPGRTAALTQRLEAALTRNVDVQAVFSVLGRAAAGEEDADCTAQALYRAVFAPEEENLAEAAAPADDIPSTDSRVTGTPLPEPPQEEQTEEKASAESSAAPYVLYTEENLPKNVQMEQSVLDFAYCTPVQGPITSPFGYRRHPVAGEERFHYGVDIGAAAGTDICCFADGTVTAVGESSSYGNYLIVAHEGGYASLYAHCSRVTAASGSAVKRGAKIAEVGDTGMATGAHLHFELQRDGNYLNPVYYVQPQ